MGLYVIASYGQIQTNFLANLIKSSPFFVQICDFLTSISISVIQIPDLRKHRKLTH